MAIGSRRLSSHRLTNELIVPHTGIARRSTGAARREPGGMRGSRPAGAAYQRCTLSPRAGATRPPGSMHRRACYGFAASPDMGTNLTGSTEFSVTFPFASFA